MQVRKGLVASSKKLYNLPMRNILKVKEFAQLKMGTESTGHDWFHVERVFKTATMISQGEKDTDLFIIQAAALLHDLGDWKVNTSDKTEEEIIADACKDLDINLEDTKQIIDIILNMSFSKNVDRQKKLSMEGKIVQDADRLEALGAIGIARAFAFGGKNNRELYNPEIKPSKYKTLKDYQNTKNPTINHFYEKLFLLVPLMNTKTGKQMAAKREKYMKNFLKQFYAEWEGEI